MGTEFWPDMAEEEHFEFCLLYLSVVSKQPLLNAFCDREVIRYLALGAKITI